MENTPNEAPAAAPAESVATPNNNSTQPDMYGFTSEQLADMKKFFDNNGGYDKVKSRISNPTPAPVQEQKPVEPERPVEPEKPAYRAPAGSITPQEFLAQQYFGALSREEKYANIAKEVESGAVLRDMAEFNIHPLNEDGSLNDAMVRKFLDFKAQTVAAKQSSAMPEAGSAPTVDYIPVDGDIKDMRQAMAILQQDSAYRSAGQAGHPSAKQAEEFMRSALNPNMPKKSEGPKQ